MDMSSDRADPIPAVPIKMKSNIIAMYSYFVDESTN